MLRLLVTGMSVAIGVSALVYIVLWVLLRRPATLTKQAVEPEPALTKNMNLYSEVVGVRNLELTTLWTRFNIHLLVNGGFLLATLAVERKTNSLLNDLSFVPYLFGLALSVLWLCSELCGRHTLHQRDAKVGEFERRFWPEEGFEVFRAIKDAHSLNVIGQDGSRGQMAVSLATIFAFVSAWAILLVFTVFY
jgi:hypothetical protein